VSPQRTVDSTVDPAQRSFFLLERDADAAMTYFYGQLFAMDSEIRAMFPPAIDMQRMRFFRALARIAAGRDDLAGLVPYLEPPAGASRRCSPKNAEIRRQASSAADGWYSSRASRSSGASAAGFGLMKLCPAPG
jgi:hypothetical protein